MDYFTIVVQVDSCEKANAKHVIQGLEKGASLRGRIGVARTDSGAHFNNEQVADWLKKRGILHEFTLPHDHKSKGLMERCNRTVLQVLRCYRSHIL